MKKGAELPGFASCLHGEAWALPRLARQLPAWVLPDHLTWLALAAYGVPHTFVFLIVIAIIMAFVLHKSVFGRHLFAVGKNEEAARYSGIRVRRVKMSLFVASGINAALATLKYTASDGTTSDTLTVLSTEMQIYFSDRVRLSPI